MTSPTDHHDDFGGLHRDLPSLVSRRRALGLLGGASLMGLLAACRSDDTETSPATTDMTTTSSTAASTTTTGNVAPVTEVVASSGPAIPAETAGPFPADGTNGPNLLTTEGIVRADIRDSIGDLSGTAEGIPATVRLTVVDAATGSALPGAAVYLWHCTADGRYSIYEDSSQNYLRGVQAADDRGVVSFTTVFPGCYNGRWPHCHFEVFDGLDGATGGRSAITTSQLALPHEVCEQAYTDSRYGNSGSNLTRLSLTGDMVFRDSWESQLATVAGSPDDGYTVDLLVRV